VHDPAPPLHTVLLQRNVSAAATMHALLHGGSETDGDGRGDVAARGDVEVEGGGDEYAGEGEEYDGGSNDTLGVGSAPDDEDDGGDDDSGLLWTVTRLLSRTAQQ
jgi:hypothetical protein